MKNVYHRIFLFLLFISSIIQPAEACFCFETAYCTYIDSYIDDHPTLLIFKGSYLQSVPVNSFNEAMQFKVEKKYRGEVITPSSPFYEGEEFTNTDSTVWLLAGIDAACMRSISQNNAIFIIPYKTGQPSWSEEFGYVPTICLADYFPISEEETITGPIWNSSESITMPVSDFESIILQDCSVFTNIAENSIESNCINVFPQPTKGVLDIEICQESKEWSAEIYNSLGQIIMNFSKNTIDISEFENGIYYIVFSIDGSNKKNIKKVIKI